MSRKVAIFDVDHTLIRHSTGRRFAMLGIWKGYLPLHLLIILPIVYFFYRRGYMLMQRFDFEIFRLGKISERKLRREARYCFLRWTRNDIFIGARDELRQLQQDGWDIVLATSSLDVLVEPLARMLGVKHVIASSLEIINGRSTGRIAGKMSFGAEKRDQVLEYLKQAGMKPEQCRFYTDSFVDMPLLEAVGTPIAVNPDPRLRAEAQRRGWAIRQFD